MKTTRPIGWHDAGLFSSSGPHRVVAVRLDGDLKLPKDQQRPGARPQRQLLLQLLPLFIGYVSLTVPAALTLLAVQQCVHHRHRCLRQGGGRGRRRDARHAAACAVDVAEADAPGQNVRRAVRHLRRRGSASENVSENGRDMSSSAESIARAAASRQGSTRRPRERGGDGEGPLCRQPRDARAQPRGPRDGERAGSGGHRGVRSGGLNEEAREVAAACASSTRAGGDDAPRRRGGRCAPREAPCAAAGAAEEDGGLAHQRTRARGDRTGEVT